MDNITVSEAEGQGKRAPGRPIGAATEFTSTGVVYGVADPVVTGLPVLGVSA